MTIADVLFFDASAVEPFRPEWNWRTDPIPPMQALSWKWQSKQWIAAGPQDLDRFVADCYDAPLLCGFNCHASVSIVKAEIIRVKSIEYYEEMAVGEALDKRKRLDLMLAAKRWTDARTVDGRLRNPTIEELFTRCFPGSSISLAFTTARVRALEQCLPRLLLEQIVELKEREYRENAGNGLISGL